MNFEFMQDLQEINKAFPFCKNAEDLARSMPDLSMVASRKSAESLAKYVYLLAHSEEMEGLTFADVLSDQAVRRYLRNPAVLDAFHFVRKSGNAAVHTLAEGSPEEAIAVLERLHFIVGELARRMSLLRYYPKFDPNIAEKPNAVLEDQDAGKLAQEMYREHVIAKNQAARFMEEFQDLAAPDKPRPGDIDLNERLEFDHKPRAESTIAMIQEHFGFLALRAMRHLQEETPERELVFKGEIKLLGKGGYTVSDLVGFMRALMYDLPNADGFTITTAYYGPSVAPWLNPEVREEFSDTVEKIAEQEQFTYSAFEFLYNHGESICGRFENGAWVELRKRFSTSIIDKDLGRDWWCWNQDLSVEFDFEKHADILAALHNIVRKYIPTDQIQYCEEAWEDGDVGILCSSIAWYPRKLREVQDFLDEINQILEPIKAECSGYGLGEWFIPTAPFAVATWDWFDGCFKIIGTEF